MSVSIEILQKTLLWLFLDAQAKACCCVIFWNRRHNAGEPGYFGIDSLELSLSVTGRRISNFPGTHLLYFSSEVSVLRIHADGDEFCMVYSIRSALPPDPTRISIHSIHLE